jgi:hypothetical protein
MLGKEKKIQEELSFLRELNNQLLKNQKDLKNDIGEKDKVC